MYALVAQLDRVTGYEPVGRGFESLPAYQKHQVPFRVLGVFLIRVVGTRNELQERRVKCRDWEKGPVDLSIVEKRVP